MGKGDKKTKRGKLASKTFGVRRPHKVKKIETAPAKKSKAKK